MHKTRNLLIVGTLSAIQSTIVCAQTTTPILHGCLAAVEAQAKFPLGAIKNNCDFPINFVYCITDINSDAIITTKRCEGTLQTQGIAPGGTVGSETDRGRAYFYACKSPDVPQDEKFVRGVGISAYCSSTPSYVRRVLPEKTVQERPRDLQIGAANPGTAQNRNGQGQAKSNADSPAQASQSNPTWDVVETSNGCKVFFEKGVLQEVERRKYRIESWTGSCVGGYASGAGSLYMAGYNSTQKEWERSKLEGTMTWGSWNGHRKSSGYHARSNTWFSYGAADIRMNCEVPDTWVNGPGTARGGSPDPNCAPVRAP